VEGFGARLELPPFYCLTLRHHVTPRLFPASCSVEATRGRFLLNFLVTSVIRETAMSFQSATRRDGPVPGGTTVVVFVEQVRR
jgi:hypothetical protein